MFAMRQPTRNVPIFFIPHAGFESKEPTSHHVIHSTHASHATHAAAHSAGTVTVAAVLVALFFGLLDDDAIGGQEQNRYLGGVLKSSPLDLRRSNDAGFDN